jgi:hypothetical protein
MAVLRIIRAADPGFEDAWDRLFESESISPFYSRRWLEYQVAYAADQHVEDLTFVGVDKSGLPVVICPLFLEQRDGRRLFSYRGEYIHALRAPVVTTNQPEKQRERVREAAFEEIDRVAREFGAVKLTMLADPLCLDTQQQGYNYLSRFGFQDASLTTVLLNLGEGLENLRSRMRASYKSLINKANAEFDIQVFDGRTTTPAIFNSYVQLHRKAAGRVTRPARTFAIQYEMILADEAILVGARQHGEWKGFVNFLHSRTATYYASGAQDPAADSAGIGPAMQWAAMKYYADRRLRWMELDNQYFGPQLFEIPSPKDIHISFYKRGFGGDLKPIFRGIKYYDREMMAQELTARTRELTVASFPSVGDATQ